MYFWYSTRYLKSKKSLRCRWSKTLGLEPPPKIVPDIEVFDFVIEVQVAKTLRLEPPPKIVCYIEVYYSDIEVITSISNFMITRYREIFEKRL
jgi:hypothetical protein